MFVKANGKLYSVLYLLTNGEASGILYTFRPTWDELKGNGLEAWNTLKI